VPSALAPRFDDMSILTLNDEEDLGRVVDRHGIVVIDFWAPWCAPCRGFLPILEKASESHPEIAFCRVNTEENKEFAQAFEVKSIPTLVVIRERIMIASQPGMLPEDVLEDLIEKSQELDMDELRREMENPEEQEGTES
jgi:thioredoxin 1